jgi:DNA (cytosine-5)-methyltransferase 1
MDRAAAASYECTFGRDIMYAGSIQDWLRDEEVPEVDVVVGGPPCQGFSNLGKRDATDERNLLWREYVRTVAKARPMFFVMENVPAFMKSIEFLLFRSATAPGGELADYAIGEPVVLNAADYGAAQVRKRTIIIGRLKDFANPGLPEPTHTGKHRTLADVWSNVPSETAGTELPESRIEFDGVEFPGAFKTSELHLTRSYTKLSLDRFEHIPPGGNRFNIPDHLLSPCWKKHKRGSVDVMGRLSMDKPSVTIRTEFNKPEKGRYLHPTEQRAITHYEAALIQGFPEDHQWVGSKVAIARQIGNAVPIPLGRAIAEHIARAIDEA